MQVSDFPWPMRWQGFWPQRRCCALTLYRCCCRHIAAFCVIATVGAQYTFAATASCPDVRNTHTSTNAATLSTEFWLSENGAPTSGDRKSTRLNSSHLG